MFKEKPTQQEVEAYENKLNYFLQGHNASIKIKLLEKPLIMYSGIHDESKEIEYFWIDSITFKTPDTNIELDHLFSQNANNKKQYLDEKFAWTDAAEIQNEVYMKLGKFKPGFSVNNGDPYWRLWDYIPKKEE